MILRFSVEVYPDHEDGWLPTPEDQPEAKKMALVPGRALNQPLGIMQIMGLIANLTGMSIDEAAARHRQQAALLGPDGGPIEKKITLPH